MSNTSGLELFARQAPPPRIEVANRFANRDAAAIPQEVVDAFIARGKRLTMASKWPNAQSTYSMWERYPLTKEDLEAISRPVRPARPKNGKDEADPGDDGFDAVRVMRVKGAFQITAEGFFSKGDCYVYIQPFDAYEAQHREATEQWLMQDDPDIQAAHYADLHAPYGQVGPQTTELSRGNPIQRLSASIAKMSQEGE